jgi:DNA helicase TIP49 (TBP-interacting protein)
MEENNEQLIAHLDMDEPFDQEISLKRLIGNDSARAILQLHIDQFFNERIAGLNPQISPILLIGGKGTGVHVMARAISNSLGNLLCHTVTAKWLNDGVIYLHSFLAEGDEFSGYYIDGDKLNSNNQLQLSKIFTEKKVFFYSFESMSWEKRPFDRLIILSTSNKNEIPHVLLKQFKIQVNLTKLTTTEIELALRQRVSLLGWTISSPELLSKIAQSCSEIGYAMQVLSMAHLVVQSKNEDILTEKQLNMALHLLDKNIKATNLNKSS